MSLRTWGDREKRILLDPAGVWAWHIWGACGRRRKANIEPGLRLTGRRTWVLRHLGGQRPCLFTGCSSPSTYNAWHTAGAQEMPPEQVHK
jgi:hypothetical protein